jgi:hypothetical protein
MNPLSKTCSTFAGGRRTRYYTRRLNRYQFLRATTPLDSRRRVIVALSLLPTDHVPTVRSVFTPGGHVHSSIGTRFT